MNSAPPLLAFYGDDFTGSADALELLSRAGVPTVLFLAPPAPERLAAYPGIRAVGVAGTTRALPPAAMEEQLRPAFARLRALGPRHVHYKVCSTFDSSPSIGSIGRAIEVGIDLFGGPFVPVLVGTPIHGRYSLFGNLFARGGIGGASAIHRLDRHPVMSRHPVTPALDSDLLRHLAQQTDRRLGLFDILRVALPPQEGRAALDALVDDGAEVIFFDILEAGHFPRLGALIDGAAGPDRPLFSVGSSGIESALTAHWAAQGILGPAPSWPEPGEGGPLLVISGSCSDITGRQIGWAAERGFAELPLDAAAAAGGERGRAAEEAAAENAAEHLQAGRSVVVHSSRGGADPRQAETLAALARSGIGPAEAKVLIGERLGLALGRIARGALARVPVRRLLVAGGDTSSYAARALGLEAVEMIAPLMPGVPLCRARAPGSPADGAEIGFKGGQVGADDFFGFIRKGRQ